LEVLEIVLDIQKVHELSLKNRSFEKNVYGLRP
jgi:hypothetical protein